MLIVLAILAGAIALWPRGRPRPDIVALLIVPALMLSGVLTPQASVAASGSRPGSRWGSPWRWAPYLSIPPCAGFGAEVARNAPV